MSYNASQQYMILRLRLVVNTVFVLLVVRHHRLVISYRSHIHSTLKMGPTGCTETPVTNNLPCLTSQKSEDQPTTVFSLTVYHKP